MRQAGRQARSRADFPGQIGPGKILSDRFKFGWISTNSSTDDLITLVQFMRSKKKNQETPLTTRVITTEGLVIYCRQQRPRIAEV